MVPKPLDYQTGDHNMTILNDTARCRGGGWDECTDCQRRTAPRHEMTWYIAPPSIVTFVCEYYIEPDRQQQQEAA